MSDFKSYFAIEKKIKAQGFDITREDIIKQFTNGKKSGLSVLTPHEYRELINWMNQRFPSAKSQFHPNPTSEALNNQRRKIIAIFRQMNYVTENNNADMERIMAWVEKSGYLHKPLNDYNLAELPKLVYQAERVLETFFKSV